LCSVWVFAWVYRSNIMRRPINQMRFLCNFRRGWGCVVQVAFHHSLIAASGGAVLYMLIFVLTSHNLCIAQEQPQWNASTSNHPTFENSDVDEKSVTPTYSFHQLLTTTAIKTYQLLISPSKGSSCPMYQHCSLYSYQSFSRFHPIKAFLMTADRLHRCGHDLDNYTPIEVDGFVRFWDPVDPTFVSSTLKSDAGWSAGQDKASFNILHGVFATTPTSDSEGSKQDSLLFYFADWLQRGGDYDRAITEYRRVLFYYTKSHYRKRAATSLLDCYYNAGQYLAAIHWGQELLGKNISSIDDSQLSFVLGCSYFRLGNYPLSITYLSEAASADTVAIKEKSVLLQGLACAYESNWKDAARSFAVISDYSEFSEKARYCEELCSQAEYLGRKRPTVAGLLAIVPGLGYLYDGYPQTALSSFLVNGLCFWGTYEAFRNDNLGVGSLLAILSFGWYSGNIYGSVISAKRKNIKLKNDLLARFDIGFSF